jgi:hypothetical protein
MNHTRWAKYYQYVADVIPAGTIVLKPVLESTKRGEEY